MGAWKHELVCTAFTRAQLPPSDVPEIALVGRSNVGKSTLINALLGRTSKKVAHVSSTPGKTRSLNFFRITPTDGGHQFCLVDLPGYGYAARGRDERDRWRDLVGGYFSSGRSISFVTHLMDFRHGPLAADVELMEWLERFDLPCLVVFSKGDKVPRGRARGMYDGYVGAGLASLAPPIITNGKNDGQTERLRSTIETAVAELKDI